MTRTLSRRAFLLSAAAAGGAAAAAVASSRTPSKPAAGTDGKRGYHATEHVNNYYRTTKV